MMDEETSKEEEPRKKRKLPIILIGFGVVNLAAIGVALFFVLDPGTENAQDQKAQDQKAQEPPKETAEEKNIGPLVKMDGFIVNIGHGETSRYLKASVAIELEDEKHRDKLEKFEMVIRNEILMYLSSLEPGDTETTEQKKAIERQMHKRIRKRIGGRFVRNVFFTEFVTQ